MPQGDMKRKASAEYTVKDQAVLLRQVSGEVAQLIVGL